MIFRGTFLSICNVCRQLHTLAGSVFELKSIFSVVVSFGIYLWIFIVCISLYDCRIANDLGVLVRFLLRVAFESSELNRLKTELPRHLEFVQLEWSFYEWVYYFRVFAVVLHFSSKSITLQSSNLAVEQVECHLDPPVRRLVEGKRRKSETPCSCPILAPFLGKKHWVTAARSEHMLTWTVAGVIRSGQLGNFKQLLSFSFTYTEECHFIVTLP